MASTPSSLSLSTAAVVAAASAIVTASLCLRRHASQLAKLEETRASERRGRIRAEMKLRSKHHDGASAALPHDLLLRCIGTVVSPYTKRMGTPRQGALVPSGRGYIQLRVPVDCVEGLERFSHAWVLFTFHANTDAPLGGIRSDGATDESRTMLQLTKTKIRPPRGGGVKVGMLATRSPHRPNNIGLSLVRLVKVDKKEKRLYIAAFDLVNGTPVYDIKPVVPWDIPGHHDNVPLSVPSWVSQDDALRKVEFSQLARRSLQECLDKGKLAPLYTSTNDGLEMSMKSIAEVLAQDPRATNTNSSNKRGSQENATNTDAYLIVFCSIELHFKVSTDGVLVEDITEFDFTNVPHVDGIPVLLDR